MAERAGIEIKFYTRVREMVGSNLGQDTVYPEFVVSFSHSKPISQSGHSRFLPNHFQFIIHLLSYHPMLYIPVADSVVK
jgi:hypothetical protein